jgi:hypothetical protein
MAKQAVDLGTKGRKIMQVIDANGTAANFVLVGWADATARRADLVGAGWPRVSDEFAVQRWNEVAPLVTRRTTRHLDTLAAQLDSPASAQDRRRRRCR